MTVVKISRKSLTVILLLAFLIACVVLYMNYSKQVSERRLAEQNLTTARNTLTKIRNEKTNQEKQLVEIQTQSEELQSTYLKANNELSLKKAALPPAADSVDYSEILFNTAYRYNVILNGVVLGSNSTASEGNLTFNTVSFSFSVRGDLEDLLNFLHALATEKPFLYGTIDTANISRVKETYTEKVTQEGSSEEEEKVIEIEKTRVYHIMDLQITLYGYEQ